MTNQIEDGIYRKTIAGENLSEYEIIDFHAHSGNTAEFYSPDGSAGAMVRTMDRIGIKAAGVSSMTALAGDFHDGNLMVAREAEAYQGRIYGYTVVNPRYPDDAHPEMEYFLNKPGMKGIKIHPTMHDTRVTDKSYAPVFEFAGEHGLPVLIHTWNDYRCHPNLFDKLAYEYPNVDFVLGHSGMPDFTAAAEAARKRRNVYLELTAASFNYGVVEYFAGLVPDEQIIYGSDMGGWFSPFYGIGSVLYAKIPDASKLKILSGNSKRLLRLG